MFKMMQPWSLLKRAPPLEGSWYHYITKSFGQYHHITKKFRQYQNIINVGNYIHLLTVSPYHHHNHGNITITIFFAWYHHITSFFGEYHVSPGSPISPYHLNFSANITISPPKKSNIKQLFDIKLSDIAIYSVEVNDIRRGAAEFDIILPRPNWSRYPMIWYRITVLFYTLAYSIPP